MKKTFSFLMAGFFLFAMASCGRKSHPSASRSYSRDTAYIPFTKNLKDLVDRNNLDIKKVQFFIDQKLIMKRSLGAQKMDIKSGVIVFENGEYLQEIIVPAYTPGVCEKNANNQMQISFEVSGSTISFAALGDNNYYRLLGHNWDQRYGTTEIVYDNQNYKVQCATCTNAGDAKLMVRKSQMENMQNASKVLEGHRVDN